MPSNLQVKIHHETLEAYTQTVAVRPALMFTKIQEWPVTEERVTQNQADWAVQHRLSKEGYLVGLYKNQEKVVHDHQNKDNVVKEKISSDFSWYKVTIDEWPFPRNGVRTDSQYVMACYLSWLELRDINAKAMSSILLWAEYNFHYYIAWFGYRASFFWLLWDIWPRG